MLKKVFITVLLIFLLTSCFWSDELEDWNIQAIYESKDISITIPSQWEVVENIQNILPKPANGEIVFDAVSKVENDNFYRNILVLKQEFKNEISSLDFVIWNNTSSKNEYFYYKNIFEKNVLIDWKKTKIYQFEARYSEDIPIFNFLQTGLVCNNKWFLITIALEKNNKSVERYEWLLASFKCKNN